MGDAGGPELSERGTRPVRIGNCSGARGDPGYQMYRQAIQGPIDFITGDYLAEMNLAENAEGMAAGKHNGWEPTCWDGICETIDVLQEKPIKVVVNGGALNPAGLARKTQELVNQKGYDLKVAYVYGDDLMSEVQSYLATRDTAPAHLDSLNGEVKLATNAQDFLDTQGKPVVSAHAYLGARAIVQALNLGADIVICGRVADASPVIGAAWWWHSWNDTQYDELAHALVAGHLIECSGYATGGNFSGFDEYDLDLLIDLPFGIVEIASDGTTVLTKHDNTKGMVNTDNARTQFLYELQGGIYLNSDVTADTTNIKIEQVGKDRVQVSNIKGYPPPHTTKLAIFYRGGYESQALINATGYGTAKKYELFEKQIRTRLQQMGLQDKFQTLDFQVLGEPASNPRTQHASTTYLRLFAQADEEVTLKLLMKAWADFSMQHFSGFHLSLDLRTFIPRPYLAFYPALYPQHSLKEGAVLLAADLSIDTDSPAGHPSQHQKLAPRANHDTANPIDLSPSTGSLPFGPTTPARLGDVTLARSGDKGANVNLGIFARHPSHYPWLQSLLSRAKMRDLLGDDWQDWWFIERMEFPNLLAIHFVIYGPLGRGVSSCRLLDCLGKGVADYIRDKVVDVPLRFLTEVKDIKAERRANPHGGA